MRRSALRRYASLLWWTLTFRLPSRIREKGCVEEIKESQLFDSQFYRATYGDLSGSRLDPITHYVRHGAREGRNPNPLFHTHFYAEKYLGSSIKRMNPLLHYIRNGTTDCLSPNPLFDAAFYVENNPEIREHGINPLLHYLRLGGRIGRDPHPELDADTYTTENPDVAESSTTALEHYFATTGQLPRRDPSSENDSKSDSIAVVLHLYYTELWPELAASLRNLPQKFDLFVSLCTETGEGFEDEIRRLYPTARVRTVENRGRDMGPFLLFLSEGAFDNYDYVCKIHSKLSPHRIDGHQWRGHLIQELLGAPSIISEILDLFAVDPSVGLIGPPTQIVTDEQYWGSNYNAVCELASRIGFRMELNELNFFQGSMFWFRPAALEPLRVLGLTPTDFEEEAGQVDGTLAHALERMINRIAVYSGFRIASRGESAAGDARAALPEVPGEDMKLIAFYLPQFHPIPENDAWWGEGFTEWTHVVRSRPLYQGHRQPRLPKDLGFYDLRLEETRVAQAEMARAHGIHGFCYYYYWFDGRKLLDRPLNDMLASGRPDFPFCICWANENWTRSWDGHEENVLLAQEYAPGWEIKFIHDVIPILRDSRYIRFQEKPVVVVYRPGSIPNIKQATETWRRECREHGVGEIHLCAALFHDTVSITGFGFDAAIEFPPHHVAVRRMEQEVVGLSSKFNGLIYDYEFVVESKLADAPPSLDPLHRGVMLAWDNSPRRGEMAHLAHGATPELYGRWLSGILAQELEKRSIPESMIFINAWNEWGEGSALEPDQDFGSQFLEVTRKTLQQARNDPHR